jgi:hypothetical protein
VLRSRWLSWCGILQRLLNMQDEFIILTYSYRVKKTENSFRVLWIGSMGWNYFRFACYFGRCRVPQSGELRVYYVRRSELRCPAR